MPFQDVPTDDRRRLRGVEMAQRLLDILGVPRGGPGYLKVELVAECGRPAVAVLTRLVSAGELERVEQLLAGPGAVREGAD